MNLAWLLVLALYAAGVFIARKQLPRAVALLFAVLVAVFLWRPLTQPVTIVPVDVLKLLPPWSELRAPGRPPVTKYDVSNLNLHDLPMQVVPWMHQVRESWRAGKVPLWNDAAGCGYPLLANGQSTPFSPFVLLTLPLPLDYAIAAQAALKLLLALTLTFLFCRRRYSILGSTMAALAYGFSTWMITWLQFPIAAAAAFLPGVLMAIEELLERRRFTLPVVAFVLTVLSGHPETVFNIGLIAAAYGLWLARSGRGLLRVIAASLVAACICAPFLAPFAEAVTRSQRFAEIGSWSGVPFSDRASAALLLQPRFFGHLPIERPWGPTTLESICGFAGVLSIACVFAAAIVVIRKRDWRGPEALHVLGAIVCLGIVLGWPGITQLFDAIAGFAPAMRMRLGLCWFASILVAFAVDRRDSRLPLLAGALGVALLMLFFMKSTPFPTESHRASALLSLLPGMAVLLALLHRRLIAVAGALTVVELWLTMAHWNPVLPARNLETPLVAKLKTLDGRIVGLGGQMYPNVGAFWGIEDVRVHDPMAFDPYVTYLERNAGWNRADYYAKWTDPDSPLLDRLDVRWIVSDRELSGRPLVYAGRDGYIYANPTARGRFFSDHAEVAVEGNRVRVKAARHALVKSSIANVPGWRASVPLFAADGPFLAFMVPPGEHAIEVAYRPRSFYLSLIPAAIATAALLVRMRRRRAPR
ncbi:MAG TPA: hypothetical protein VEO54_32520 [Thermoanaerobaculia bacterium]|nr:hypothetical protein [Thermoanaerobaculia bacterium]